MSDHVFCRSMLREVMQDVRKHVSAIDRKKSWTAKIGSRGTIEFNGPNGFYHHGSSCCKWFARYNGWCSYLGYLGVDGYTLHI